MVARSTTLGIDLARSPWARARWLVIAPHADDETLGVGALIVQAARSRRLGAVVYMTDGAGSHPHADARSRQALIAMRRQEAALSLRRLAGNAAPQPNFLDWPDARPHQAGSPLFDASRQRLSALCRRHRIDAIAVTAGHEPHCDHVAAFALARAVSGTPGLGHVALFEYIVWADTPPQATPGFVRTAPVPPGLRHDALMAHRSQLGPAFGDGFRLPAWQTKMAGDDRLYLRKSHHVGR